MTIARAFAAATLLMAAAVPAAAHHSYAMFDNPKKQTLSGTVRADEPPRVGVGERGRREGRHRGLGVRGAVAERAGAVLRMDPNSLSPGDKVSVDFSPVRSGRPGGALRLLTFADGRTLKTARTNPPGSPAELAAPGPAK